MLLYLVWIVGLVIAPCLQAKLPSQCYSISTTPHEDEHSEDHGFELRLRRLTDGVMVDQWYEPGRKYLVILTNRYFSVDYRNAILWSSTDNESSNDAGQWIELNSAKLSRYNLGQSWFTNVVFANLRPGCNRQTAEKQKQFNQRITKLIIVWQAPNTSNPGCVHIRSAVQTHYRRLRTYNATDGLSKTLCPSSTRPPSPVLPAYMVAQQKQQQQQQDPLQSNRQKNVMKMSNDETMHMDNMQPKDCCACGSATYKITFQGLWTRETHPKDWPIHNPGLLHWTNFIGTSHSSAFQLYQIGEPASAGIQALCTYGDTTIIKQSLGLAASNTNLGNNQGGAVGVGPLHSLVSAPGMWSEETLNESRTIYVAVNRTHPLVSLVSMLGPSPNWCAGLSGQSVCQAGCTWISKLEIDLFPWDAGSRHGNTYIPKEADRKEIPDPIRFITRNWMPSSPFTPQVPVAKVTLERILPKHSWECTTTIGDGVELFNVDGSSKLVGKTQSDQMPKSVMGDLTTTLTKKSRHKSNPTSGAVLSTGGLSKDNPLSDPSLAQMATFLCQTDAWSPWNPCSVTCGVGKRTRSRNMILNKKNELCQHLPLMQEEPCEGRKRTCDFSNLCSLLPWTDWTPCNATCLDRNGVQTRTRYLVRPSEKPQCLDYFKTSEEQRKSVVIEKRHCTLSETQCDPVSICGEGRKDGVLCGTQVSAYYYNALEHACVEFKYLGCKGGRNRFATKAMCETMCLTAVERLPAWRRERLSLLQLKTSQLDASGNDEMEILKPTEECFTLMDPGKMCKDNVWAPVIRWYFSPRMRRCREFDYHGCGGTSNNFKSHENCMATCMPVEMEKHRLMTKARIASSKVQGQMLDRGKPSDLTNTEWQKINTGMWGSKQDCILTPWSAWSPCLCSVNTGAHEGNQWRWRHVKKPSMHNGQPCQNLFEHRHCNDC